MHTFLWSPPATPEPEAEASPAEEPPTWPLPRVFAAPIRRTFITSGGMVLDAIADDGTCWEMYPGGIWEQIPELPQPEV